MVYQSRIWVFVALSREAAERPRLGMTNITRMRAVRGEASPFQQRWVPSVMERHARGVPFAGATRLNRVLMRAGGAHQVRKEPSVASVHG